MDGADTTDVVRAALASQGEHQAQKEALDRLYERCAPKLLSYIRLKLGRSLRERLESRDILQATLLKSFQHLDEFRGADGRSLMAWLARIADHEIVDRADYHHRQRRDAGREVPARRSSRSDGARAIGRSRGSSSTSGRTSRPARSRRRSIR